MKTHPTQDQAWKPAECYRINGRLFPRIRGFCKKFQETGAAPESSYRPAD